MPSPRSGVGMNRATRHRWIAAVAVSSAAAYMVLGTDVSGEAVSGPLGAHPPPIADEAPADPSRVLSTANDPRIVDGLRVERSADHSALVAHDLRSGEVHWSLTREGRELRHWRASAESGVAYLLWDDDQLTQFDIRTAQTVWRQDVASHMDEGSDHSPLLVAAESFVAVAVDDRVYGHGGVDGEHSWSASLPEACKVDGRSQALAVGDSLALEAKCDESQDGVALVDPQGTLDWIDADWGNPLVPLENDRFGVAGAHGGMSIYSVAGGVVDEAPPADELAQYVGGSDMHVAARNNDAQDEGDLAYAVWDLATDELAWSLTTDGSWRPRQTPVIADGLMYTLQSEVDETALRELAVYDVETGAELSRVDVDMAEYSTAAGELAVEEMEIFISDVAAGTVTLTVGDLPFARTSAYCDPCSIVLTEP